MKKALSLASLLCATYCFAQQDSIPPASTPSVEEPKEKSYVWVFSSPRVINATTVEMISRHVLEFKVTHNFGDIAGDNGGSKTAFGLDNATDVRIGFQYGISNNLNIILARAKGASIVSQLYEFGIKYRFLRQTEDNSTPLSAAIFANNVISAQKANTVANQPNTYQDFSDRNSQTVQLMLARKFGKLSLQVNPTLVHTNYVVAHDQNTLFALGGALRLPVKGRFSILVDYFHTFRNTESKNLFKSQGTRFYDALGVGVEILTAGHVFHLNFTNATEILENRFVPRTVTSWSKGQFRWGFTISRDFNLFYKKKNK